MEHISAAFSIEGIILTARARKFWGGIGLVLFVIVWAVACAMIAEHLPNWRLLKLAFFVVAGMGWGLPILPLLSWMNRGSS